MLKSVCLVGALMLLVSPALADTPCGMAPIADEIPAPAAVAGKTAEEATAIKHKAFVDVKAYQGKLKSFRECLVAQTTALKSSAAEAKDDKAKKAVQEKMDEMQKVYDKAYEDETKVVNDFVALQTAVCKIVDCTPKK